MPDNNSENLRFFFGAAQVFVCTDLCALVREEEVREAVRQIVQNAAQAFAKASEGSLKKSVDK